MDDWLLTLEHAAVWNGWSDSEKLMQLAGYLRGRALQEWNLLLPEDGLSFSGAVQALRGGLDTGSQVLAAQDFRYSMQ